MEKQKHVGLLVTCLADMFRPEVAFAAMKLLREAGCKVSVPRTQTCCGQVAHNSGDLQDARTVATGMVRAFAAFDYVVAPSGSCAGMVRHQYPGMFPKGDPLHEAAKTMASKTYELLGFLTDVLGVTSVAAKYPRTVTYHDSCSSRREMDIREQPRTLLGSVQDLALKESSDPEACCGFGGTFCVKYGAISTRMADERLADFDQTGAEVLLGGDLGCLMNLAGRLSREGSSMEVRHIAEVLADMADDLPPIAGAQHG